MRIIGGNLKGSKLYLPEDDKTRPLKDLVRESIFNLINHSNKVMINLNGSNILDIYAGTGSFGLECLSRGAKHISFIENNRYDLIIFLSPHRLATYCGKTNFIFNIWDIDHKKNTPYPEHRINYNYRKREDLIDFVLFHAFKIVVPDKKTNRELKKIYNCDEKKLKIQNFIPFIPRLYESDKNIDYQKIFTNFNLGNKKYILYPATFWPHKNHQYLIDVAKIFKLNNIPK